jgi:hypothetical protein
MLKTSFIKDVPRNLIRHQVLTGNLLQPILLLKIGLVQYDTYHLERGGFYVKLAILTRKF